MKRNIECGENDMHATVKQPKEVVRLQFDIRRAQLGLIEMLVDICGLSSKKELFNNSLALMKWAVEETRKGRRIASYNEATDELELVALPALSMVAGPEPELHEVPASTRQTATSDSKRERRIAEPPPLKVAGAG